MISVGGHYVTGLLVAPWMENAAPRILCGWQHNDSVSEATRSEVNVEMAARRSSKAAARGPGSEPIHPGPTWYRLHLVRS